MESSEILYQVIPEECKLTDYRNQVLAQFKKMTDANPQVDVLEKEFSSRFKICNKLLFKNCFTNLKSEIDKNTLDHFFLNQLKIQYLGCVPLKFFVIQELIS
jgi:hypothetical protein